MKTLGIDIGGTGIKGAIVNTKTGELVSERFRIATPNILKQNAKKIGFSEGDCCQ